MVKIERIVLPEQLYQALTAIQRLPGAPSLTVTEVRCFHPPDSVRSSASPGLGDVRGVESTKLECVVPRSMAQSILDTLDHALRGTASADETSALYDLSSTTPSK